MYINQKLNFGQQFRKIRKDKKIILSQAADGITSKSHLARWETGQDDMQVGVLLKLLERIHIQPEEFFLGNEQIDLYTYTNEISTLYLQNKLEILKRLSQYAMSKYVKNPNKENNFFKSAIAANFYMDLTNINLFSKENCKILSLRFKKLTAWYIEDVLLFGNTQLLLNENEIYIDTRSLVSSYFDNPRMPSTILNTVLNSIFALLKKHSIREAERLLKIIKERQLPQQYAFEKIRIQFMGKLISYINNHNDKDIYDFLQNLRDLQLTEQADGMEFAFSQIEKLYK